MWKFIMCSFSINHIFVTKNRLEIPEKSPSTRHSVVNFGSINTVNIPQDAEFCADNCVRIACNYGKMRPSNKCKREGKVTQI